MNTINTVGTGAATTSQGASAAAGGGALGKDAFLKMLVTELRMQDPLSPMEDRDFIAQLAQFSSLEQLQNIGKSFGALEKSIWSSQAVSLIGKTVDAVGGDDEPVHGTVSAVKFGDSGPVLMVGNREILLGDIVSVR